MAETWIKTSKTAKIRELQIIRSTINPPYIRRSREIPEIPEIPNCRFCNILAQVVVIFAKCISWYCCISCIIKNLHAECTKMHYCKYCALRGSLNLMAPNFELCCLSLPPFYRKSHNTFYCMTQHSSYVLSENSANFGMTFAYFWFWTPRNEPNKHSTTALVSKASDWSWRC